MSRQTQRGTTLVVGLILLALTTLLGLAGAASAHIEVQLAHNEQFRENASSAASAGIEFAISQIVITPEPDAVPTSASAAMPGATDRFEYQTRFLGLDTALPQAAGANLAGAHFEITSTGYSARRAIDRQRAIVMHVIVSSDTPAASPCEPEIPGVRCHQSGDLVRLSWQRLAAP
ncbi:MAG TPA: PilX N-terminal domain-containing pilus assembly protein [Steroidobacteraceae bacterium]|nr:PilX N-terminal domain-containing pilus assembly protein [Steroidobacteraceae bacterium]